MVIEIGWTNNNFTKDKWLCISGEDENGFTWARIVEKLRVIYGFYT